MQGILITRPFFLFFLYFCAIIIFYYILFTMEHRKHIKCLRWEDEIGKFILNLMAGCFKKEKVVIGWCLPLYSIPYSFSNSTYKSGNWLDRLLKFWERNVVLFLSDIGSQLLYCPVLKQCTWIFLLWNQAVVLDAVCSFASSCWDMQGLPG